MPAATRSAGKQATLEDVGAGGTKPAKQAAKSAQSKATSFKKRKADEPPSQKTKDVKKSKKEDGSDADPITINRAPVLELWTSCVTHFLYPSISWSTCLSVGSAVATITAISKGRSIGTINKPDPGEAEEKKQKRKKKAEKEELEELEVMSFKLRLDKEGQALVGEKPKKAGEDALKKKYGDSYEKVKTTFDEALQSWKGKEQELDERSFSMYEDFRPTIPPGQSGWGRKGQLNLKNVKSAVSSA